ncbi:hypothetical protein KC19_1G080700 [Ceratodon purpureus]|uniref:HMA domain-containing protein n=1 Tax=Ceratodon purpureus TaxID=3225 RepID=A0A8T0J5V5_CERPU|nr:hypothetical protein KC19_1G080700 [Ceratodon purpureus]
MAMSMQELFYGQNEPAYFAHYGRQAPVPYSHAPQIPLPEPRPRRMELITFDMMVPMCCTQCEDQVRDAILALGSVRDVVCDPRNQRVSVTGCLDPTQALKQARRVKNGAMFWSDVTSLYTTHRSAAPSHQQPHRVQLDNRVRRSHVRSDPSVQRSHPRNSTSDAYTRSFCPAYRDAAQTFYIDLNPTMATVEESEY